LDRHLAPSDDAPDAAAAQAAGVPRCLTAEEALVYVLAAGSPPPDWTGPRASPDPLLVQEHLDECDRCRMVLAEAVRAARRAEAATAGHFRTLADGQTLLGRYQIQRFIARGGMGEVYEAFDTAINERVALKTLLLTALDDQRAVERLAAEVRLARKVTHPNVCRILEFGVYQRGEEAHAGIPFLTMEFLTGEGLARRIRERGPLPPPVVARMVADVTAGLAAIHAAGIVHRDFKSENVLLVPDLDGKERAVIMDFGLARGLAEGAQSGSSTEAAGTPDYMAPEQVEGKPPTPAFDIYALGIVVFEMLTGQKPFPASSPYMTALRRLQHRAPAPSERVDGLAPVWDAVVGRCLERQPERRFARVQEVASALDAAVGREEPRARAWLPWGTGAALLALAAVLLTLRFTSARPASPPLAVAQGPPVAMSAVAGPAVERAAPAPAAQARAPAAAPARSRAARARPRKEEAPPPPVRADRPEALLRQAQSLMLEGNLRQACELGERAAAHRRGGPAAELFLGKCYSRLGASDLARRHYRRYLELAPDAPDGVFVRGILEGGS
jgi:tRNA A-37 threonylcarbamoyl transferase component Bud32